MYFICRGSDHFVTEVWNSELVRLWRSKSPNILGEIIFFLELKQKEFNKCEKNHLVCLILSEKDLNFGTNNIISYCCFKNFTIVLRVQNIRRFKTSVFVSQTQDDNDLQKRIKATID